MICALSNLAVSSNQSVSITPKMGRKSDSIFTTIQKLLLSEGQFQKKIVQGCEHPFLSPHNPPPPPQPRLLDKRLDNNSSGKYN